ncbi:hybrid cluster protein-associated redox disulfide domain-containing protein [Litoreibacter ascidiaceicola]|uniref:Hybrid cluster protein-associated redox disulfide domain-containing protein n=1 Tax=Litoreibacter ascidiaceicola TaxID=1486859 RepID=A0A1M4ZUE3_9RHOB|nr:DUF1858 domain-containing protein [Litoreibacter ascidiaceicola]SHF21581.1 hybrid cluster protein-associated redox disulfide domain-containing protein [Litoreibacter ascidiaceicola]
MPHRKFDDPDLPLQDLMSRWPQTIEVFLRHKMLCVGCMITPFHAVIDACIEYHLDYDTFIDELRAVIETGV